jgi:hypothetical protein
MPQDSILENLFFFTNDARTFTYFLQSLTFVAEAISLPVSIMNLHAIKRLDQANFLSVINTLAFYNRGLSFTSDSCNCKYPFMSPGACILIFYGCN